MLEIWAVSLYLEAVLVAILVMQGGFPAFVRFLAYDVLTQALGIACSGSSQWYPLVHRWSETGAVVMLGLVVREVIAQDATTDHQGSSDDGRLLAFCAATAIAIHLVFAESVPWSIWASGVWQMIALSHSIMGMYVGATTRSTHGRLLTFWLLAYAALFYAAPHYPVGMGVLWLNATTWALWIAVSVVRAPACSPGDSSEARLRSPRA